MRAGTPVISSTVDVITFDTGRDSALANSASTRAPASCAAFGLQGRYVGSWLSEPLLTAPDVAEDVELADGVSMAMLLDLKTLTPAERVVFVLREVFDLLFGQRPATTTP